MSEPLLTLVAATRNRAKVEQLVRLAGDLARFEPLPDGVALAANVAESVESGDDIVQIAVAKAVAWSTALGTSQLVVATDGGLLVPDLGDRWQPARTRRFAGPAATDLDRAQRLLDLARGLTGKQRRIGWREALAVAQQGRELAHWSAESDPGLLAESVDEAAIARGRGFWVSAVWRCPEFAGRLLVDLPPDEAARLHDHWTRLREPFRDWLAVYGLRVSRS